MNYFLKIKDESFETPLGFFVLLVKSVLSVLLIKSDFLFLLSEDLDSIVWKIKKYYLYYQYCNFTVNNVIT